MPSFCPFSKTKLPGQLALHFMEKKSNLLETPDLPLAPTSHLSSPNELPSSCQRPSLHGMGADTPLLPDLPDSHSCPLSQHKDHFSCLLDHSLAQTCTSISHLINTLPWSSLVAQWVKDRALTNTAVAQVAAVVCVQPLAQESSHAASATNPTPKTNKALS